MSDYELFEVMKSQMGIDPASCDPATIELYRSKFFGGEKKQKKKTKKP